MAKQQPARPSNSAKTTPKPGDGLLGWFGRQVGHVKNAVQADVTRPKAKKPAAPTSRPSKPAASAKPQPARAQPARPRSAGPETATPPPEAAPASPGTKVIYREDKVEEADLPNRPGMKLRRTIIDEVVVEEQRYTEDAKSRQ